VKVLSIALILLTCRVAWPKCEIGDGWMVTGWAFRARGHEETYAPHIAAFCKSGCWGLCSPSEIPESERARILDCRASGNPACTTEFDAKPGNECLVIGGRFCQKQMGAVARMKVVTDRANVSASAMIALRVACLSGVPETCPLWESAVEATYQPELRQCEAKFDANICATAANALASTGQIDRALDLHGKICERASVDDPCFGLGTLGREAAKLSPEYRSKVSKLMGRLCRKRPGGGACFTLGEWLSKDDPKAALGFLESACASSARDLANRACQSAAWVAGLSGQEKRARKSAVRMCGLVKNSSKQAQSACVSEALAQAKAARARKRKR
jgi:hypothetical protein